MRVITISGKAEAGKDTAAKLLKTQLEDSGYSVLITHYADLLKYICRQFFDWNGKKDEVGRTLLQKVGTEGVRVKNPDYWVKFIINILEFFPNDWDYVLIPDTRFPNEVNLMKEKFSSVSVNIVRDGYENHLTPEQRLHASETALDDFNFDYTIHNVGNMDDFNSAVAEFVIALNLKGEDI